MSESRSSRMSPSDITQTSRDMITTGGSQAVSLGYVDMDTMYRSYNMTIANYYGRRSGGIDGELLSKLDMYDYLTQKNRVAKMLKNTGRWLLDDPKSFTWMYAPSSSLLVVTGSASQGKSVLARELAENLFSMNESLLDTAKDSVCYFFFNESSEKAKSPTYAMAGILHQWFSHRFDLLAKRAVPEYKKSPNTVLTSFDLMWKILEETAIEPDAGTIVCILDGLEKCNQDTTTAPGLKALLDKLGYYYGTENHKVHSVTHLKFFITARPSEELDEIQNIRCEHCTSIQQVACEDAANQISRDIDEVIKTLIYNLSDAGILLKFRTNFAKLLQDYDVPTWEYLRTRLRRKGITTAMIEKHVDSIITWVAKATNTDISKVEGQAPSVESHPSKAAEAAEAAEAVTENISLPHSPRANDAPHLSEEPEAMTEEEHQVLGPEDSGPPPNRVNSPAGPPRAKDQETPTERIRPEPQRRQSTSIPFRRRAPASGGVDETNISNKSYLSHEWFRKYEKALDYWSISCNQQLRRTRRIKIAILSSGVDLEHDFIQFGEDRVRRVETASYSSETSDGPEDDVGMGTHSVGLLLRLAPEAEVYVFKVTKGREIQSELLISQAIDHATSVIEADIISLGFGYSFTARSIQRSIKLASSKDVIIFSGAGNNGANEAVAYPARDPRVICIYSTDGYGNRSAFNPPQLSDGRGFSTLGEQVASLWPERLVGDDRGSFGMNKSGSSVAATIASGISAMVLDIVQVHMHERMSSTRLEPAELRALLNLMAVERDGYKYLVPWKLFESEEGQSTADQVMNRILNAINYT